MSGYPRRLLLYLAMVGVNAVADDELLSAQLADPTTSAPNFSSSLASVADGGPLSHPKPQRLGLDLPLSSARYY